MKKIILRSLIVIVLLVAAAFLIFKFVQLQHEVSTEAKDRLQQNTKIAKTFLQDHADYNQDIVFLADMAIKSRYNRFRYYDPESGIYISQDPIGLHGGIQFYGYVHDTNGWIDVFGLRGKESFPSWMKKTKGFERHHIIPYHLKDHPIISKSGMNINGATNMVSLPRYEGNHPTKVTHRHFKIGGEPHADYNAKMLGELDELNNRAIAENWNSERMRQEILDLQHDTRKKLNNRAGYKGCKG